ncbi:uncharacterized protein N7459_000540 [Penicillium hispanicum]|uniref:uncharacterized protein n=1 Tax=Penicillium hispanicum TaxID=1080232 RepID=UPI002541F109|nr:uncharacterized protein N7459_000540 [Penicillium hispanicum]KAJ5594332.1 hypothetical protein N7459_000540 [Penicillium hispanicum]
MPTQYAIRLTQGAAAGPHKSVIFDNQQRSLDLHPPTKLIANCNVVLILALLRKGIDPGTIITLDQPFPLQWKILEKLNERDFQVNKEKHDDYSFSSLASATLLYCNSNQRTKKEFMRIYVQVPIGKRKWMMWIPVADKLQHLPRQN